MIKREFALAAIAASLLTVTTARVAAADDVGCFMYCTYLFGGTFVDMKFTEDGWQTDTYNLAQCWTDYNDNVVCAYDRVDFPQA